MRGSRFTVGIIIIVAILAVSLFLVFRLIMSEPTTNNTSVTLEGKTVCLPHKNASGPVTLECAAGIMADDGRYYAVRSTNSDTQIANVPSGSRIQITGTLIEPEANEKYDIAGIIEAIKVTPK